MARKEHDLELDWYVERAEQLCLDYLKDAGNYPIIDGEVAFFDEESYNEFTAYRRFRQPDHLIDQWVVKFWLTSDDKIKWLVENEKYVGGAYNLLNLLEQGNSEVTIPYWQREMGKRMSYYYRYKSRWYFNRTYRHAMRPIFKKEIKLLIQAAVDYAFDTADEEMKETIGWER